MLEIGTISSLLLLLRPEILAHLLLQFYRNLLTSLKVFTMMVIITVIH